MPGRVLARKPCPSPTGSAISLCVDLDSQASDEASSSPTKKVLARTPPPWLPPSRLLPQAKPSPGHDLASPHRQGCQPQHPDTGASPPPVAGEANTSPRKKVPHRAAALPQRDGAHVGHLRRSRPAPC